MIYVLDTNTIIHYLGKKANVLRNFDNAAMQNFKLIIPKAVDYEVRRGLGIYPAPRKEKTYNILTRQCIIGEVGSGIWDRATQIYIDLYKKRFTVGEIDMLIGAYCLVNGYTLVTSNTKDFENMDGLKLVDWMKPTP